MNKGSINQQLNQVLISHLIRSCLPKIKKLKQKRYFLLFANHNLINAKKSSRSNTALYAALIHSTPGNTGFCRLLPAFLKKAGVERQRGERKRVAL